MSQNVKEYGISVFMLMVTWAILLVGLIIDLFDVGNLGLAIILCDAIPTLVATVVTVIYTVIMTDEEYEEIKKAGWAL